jgi:hypothetical protein
MFGGKVSQKKLSSRDFFDAIYRTNFDTKTTLSTAPIIDKVIIPVRNNGVLWTNQTTVIT